MSETNPPPVAPVEGHYARMRDGAVVGPIRNASAWYTTSTDKWGCWHTDFLWDDSGRLAGKAYDPDLDIIATISPADMQAVAGGELERLRTALQNIQALAAKRQHEGGPDGNLKAIEEFAVYGLEGKNP